MRAHVLAGAHVRSAGAIRTFAFFMVVSIVVDLLWLFVYSPLRPIAFETLLALSRKDQVRTCPRVPSILARDLGARAPVALASAADVVTVVGRASAQLSLLLSVLNTAYKGLVVWTATSLHICFKKREALIEQMELDAGLGTTASATTSSGEPLDARSLAAQVAR